MCTAAPPELQINIPAHTKRPGQYDLGGGERRAERESRVGRERRRGKRGEEREKEMEAR